MTENKGIVQRCSSAALFLFLPALLQAAPYNGSPFSVPGIIQMEEYDTGPAETAYHDATPGNSGGSGYRWQNGEAADIGFVGGNSASGYAVVQTSAGEWLTYTVNVNSSGRFRVKAHIASSGPGGGFQLSFSGVDKTGLIPIPDTKAGQSERPTGWRMISGGTVDLDAGVQVMRFTFTAGDGSGGQVEALVLERVLEGPPSLDAGPDQSVQLPAGVSLVGNISGLDEEGLLRWEKLSGPGDVDFSYQDGPRTAAYFSAPGTYVLRLTGSNGGASSQDTVTVTAAAAPVGRTFRVTTVSELRGFFGWGNPRGLAPGDTVLLADGVYDLAANPNRNGEPWFPVVDLVNVTLRSESDDPARVTLRGGGFFTGGSDLMRIIRSRVITIRSLTFADNRDQAVKVETESQPIEDIRFENCRFVQIGERMIKGTAGVPADVALRGWVKHCSFENTDVPAADHCRSGSCGDYIAGIDMMKLRDWVFSDNTVLNVRGLHGEGRAGFFIWNDSRGVVMERNRVVGSDRGLAFGNPSGTAGVNHVEDGLMRNNFIVTSRGNETPYPGHGENRLADIGIELARVDRVKVYNNTVWQPREGQGITSHDNISNTRIVNNIVSRGAVNGELGFVSINNLFDPPDAYFFNAAGGDLRLTSGADLAIAAGVALPEVSEDFDRAPRGNPPSIGASERFGAPLLPPARPRRLRVRN